ncbi:16S rRNA (guanine(527)-N(7))-methyltransferase RsmG [Pseudodonghicola flavimaris]|uniref:Ribosomal RNA small subunit methyltransferase G n=1 Tax=Pseudodonghicola flavimaris TaxID=3050036 RepID=A0ABT7EZT4_9RHOB|nr:16S rRNA (guanine(527)-N(7))-methyltransferase RsmG [Pseudodonghicola flavimaris]MDK3017858.1 16S rRNA (guanine(527)-N(7))-methyltransferase RsmG [Pseudodonghicola flavimaris]
MRGAGALLEELNVSRETLSRLETFAELLKKWNPKINLVSRASLEHLWTRHIVDSVQVFRCVRPQGQWVDMGSGGGFPGVIVAILAAEEAPELAVTLIESDQRKSAFLRTAARECGVACKVLSDRIESVPPQQADILSARALADLDALLGFAERHLKSTGTALFPKGISWGKECEQARRRWNFSAQPITSKTEPDAVILKIEGVSRG